MDKEEFIFEMYKDNVMIIKRFKILLKDKYNIVGDKAINIVNRILDYQRLRYGDALEQTGIYIPLSLEEKLKVAEKARQRRYYNKSYERR